MSKSLAKNSIFYMRYNILNMLFPFFTSIYVARILLPVSIGEVAYAQNIVTYFSILAFLGIPTYGVREIAKVRKSSDELNAVFSELFIINGISTIVFSITYYILVFSIPDFRENYFLYSIVGLTVILNALNISWFFEGIEEFGYISLRNAIFKLIMLCLVILLVRDEQDTIPYAAISVFGLAGNNIINIIHARKFVCFKTQKLNFRRHLKSVFTLLFVNIAIEIYTLVDTTMLGILSSKEHVAYYFYASKVNKILLQITNTVTMVLVPRISMYYGENKIDEFNALLTKGLKIIIIGAIPMIIGLQFVSTFLFSTLFGASYIVSGSVEKILCYVLLISPIGYLLGSRVMLVSNHESQMVVCVSAGAIINFIGNFILIRYFNEIGAAIASVLSEFVVMIMYVHYGKKVYNLYSYKDTIFKVGIAGICEIMMLIIIDMYTEPSWIILFMQVISAACTYMFILCLLNENIVKKYIVYLSRKILQIFLKA